VRTVVYEHQAAAALDTARILFKRDDAAGRSMGGTLRLLVFRQAKSVGMPAIECIFDVRPDKIVIHDLEFS
jgi:hypothetical protein